ncbi:MAG TPA: hypothetical protein PLE72_01755 [Azospira sp.]|nr:hypothetical protein [Azospira sp.]HNN45780.1 hypothetical protein [Azospira sp.]
MPRFAIATAAVQESELGIDAISVESVSGRDRPEAVVKHFREISIMGLFSRPKCPKCEAKFELLSAAYWSKKPACKSCGAQVRPKFEWSRYFVISALIFFPLRLLAIYIKPLAFLHSSLTTGFALGVGLFLCIRFQLAEEVAPTNKDSTTV